jgi:hypothetical protein
MPPPLPPATVSGAPPYEQNGPPLPLQYYGILAAKNAINNYIDPTKQTVSLPYREGWAGAFSPSQLYYMNEDEAAIMYEYSYLDELLGSVGDWQVRQVIIANEGDNAFVAYRTNLWNMSQDYKPVVQPIWDRMRQLGKQQVTYNPMISH